MSWLSDTLFGSQAPVQQAQQNAIQAGTAASQAVLGQIPNLFGSINPYSGPTYNTSQLNPQFMQAQNLASQQLGAAGQYDMTGNAQNFTNMLNQMAVPQEQIATNQLANRLFSSGRLGTTGGAQNLAQLSLAQQNAATNRAMQGYGLAQSAQNQLFQQGAGLLGQLTGAEQGYAGMGLQARGQDIGAAGAQLQGYLGAQQLGLSPYLMALQTTQPQQGLVGQLGGLIGGLGLAGGSAGIAGLF